MAFVTDKEELKTGLIIFRRGDVKHETWYCRLKLPKTDRYKTTSLLTTDVDEARVRALEHEADIRLRLKYDIPVFSPSFREVARKYLQTQKARAQRGEVSEGRSNRIRAILEGVLDTYLGSTPVHLVGDASYAGYPAWRRENGAGRSKRNGIREVGFELAQALAVREAERRTKVRHTLGLRHLPQVEVKIPEDRMIPFVSDATIRFEMSIFRAVLRYAKSKGYVSASMHFDDGPKLKTVRREGFTWEEIDRLRKVGWRMLKNPPASGIGRWPITWC